MTSIIFFPLFLMFSSLYAFIGRVYHNYHRNFLILILIALYTFILGVRVNFGTDQTAYLHMYFYQGADLLRTEKLYVLLNQFLRSFNAPYQLLFAIIAFAEIYLLILVFEREQVDIFWGYILFFLIYIHLNLNLSRQAVAMGFVLLSIVFFAERKYLSWGILTVVATGFHISSVLGFFIVPFINLIKNIRIPKFIYYVSFFLASFFFEQMFDIVIDIFLMPLNRMFGNRIEIIQKVLSMKIPLGSGMGVRLRGVSYICLMPLLFDYKQNNAKNSFYFSLMIFGLLGEFLSSVNMNLSRIFFYYSQVQLIVIPQVLKKTSISSLKKIKAKEVLFILGLFFIFILAVPKWVSGADTTEFYQMNLNFNLLENHSF